MEQLLPAVSSAFHTETFKSFKFILTPLLKLATHYRVQTICVSYIRSCCVTFLWSAGTLQSLLVAFVVLSRARVSYCIVHCVEPNDTYACRFLLFDKVSCVPVATPCSALQATAFRGSFHDCWSLCTSRVKLHLICIS
jgi:hypothetical protein